MNKEEFERFKSLLKRRGFVFANSEIYGGAGNLYDFGPLGSLLKIRFKNLFLKRFVQEREDIELIDASILMRREVWQASGHEKNFNDILVECFSCKSRFRYDFLLEGKYGVVEKKNEKLLCPSCGALLSDPRPFNMMFETYMGPAKDSAALSYLRPETAQGIFVNFKNVLQSSRQKIPFGIAQIGKAFRNEITPGDFLFRVREFEQCEIEYFIHPSSDEEKYFEDWFKAWWQFFVDLGISEKHLLAYDHPKEKLAHYSRGTRDINYCFPFGISELAGVAKRGDFDLRAHEEFSGTSLKVYDELKKDHYLPWVIEPTLGIERALFALLLEAYKEYPSGRKEKEDSKDEKGSLEIVLHLSPVLAPYQIAVLPLVKKSELVDFSRKIFENLKKEFFVVYDEVASIGRRYRRQDEIGTPWAITVDFQTLQDNTVTIRDRDSMRQLRINCDNLEEFFEDRLKKAF